MFLTIITFFVVLSLLVFVHEFGHFWIARFFGLKPEEFGFGLPPRVFGVYKNKAGRWLKTFWRQKVDDADDTIYSINLFPIGGFVKLGEDDVPDDDPNHFNNKPVWQRLSIVAAGVTMNIVLAAVLVSFGYMIGSPQVINDNLSERANVKERRVQVAEVFLSSPAAEAELETGDTIVAVDSQLVSSSEFLQNYTDQRVGEEVIYKIKRRGIETQKKIIPEIRPETNRGGIGIGIAETGNVSYPIHIAIWEGVKTTLFWTWFIIVAFYSLIKDLILGLGVTIDLGGPVRIAQITGDAARMGLAYLINFTAILSINLAIINAFPFPALDGGRIIFLLIEKLKGSPVRKETEAVIHNIGFALLMVLIILVTYRDIVRVL